MSAGEITSPVWPRRLLLGGLFLAALGIRLYHITDPPVNFHATRQYRSYVIARGFYFDHTGGVPAWQRDVARCSQRLQGLLEPPIMEAVTAVGYRLVGGERMWLPRCITIACWLAGGVALYAIARRITDGTAALFAVGFYLLLPFGVAATRGFQPDPLMVLLMLAGVWAILRHDEAPTRQRLAAAAALASLAVVVKPGSVFIPLATFLSLAFRREGIRRALTSGSTVGFVLTLVLPTLAIYAYGTLSGAFLVNEARKTLLPQLWVSAFFWRGWLGQIGATVGFPCFVAALLGAFAFRRGTPQYCIAALWVGYVVFCLSLNYNLATHDYYQLQLIPIVGLSLGVLVAMVQRSLWTERPEWYWRAAMASVWVLAVALSLADARARLVYPSGRRMVANQQAIGAHVRHSERTIFLSGDYGVPLEYNGLLCGISWPLGWDLEWERLAGRPATTAEQRFDRWYAKDAPEYFIVEDLNEYAAQPDLQRFLARFPVIARSDAFMIYALTGR